MVFLLLMDQFSMSSRSKRVSTATCRPSISKRDREYPDTRGGLYPEILPAQMQSDSVIPEACNGHSQGHRRGQSQQVYPIFGLVHDFHTGGPILGKSTD